MKEREGKELKYQYPNFMEDFIAFVFKGCMVDE